MGSVDLGCTGRWPGYGIKKERKNEGLCGCCCVYRLNQNNIMPIKCKTGRDRKVDKIEHTALHNFTPMLGFHLFVNK